MVNEIEDLQYIPTNKQDLTTDLTNYNELMKANALTNNLMEGGLEWGLLKLMNSKIVNWTQRGTIIT